MHRLRLALFLLAMLLLLAGCKVQLFSNLQEKEVNEMLAILKKSGLEANKQPGDKDAWNLMVEESHLAEAVELLDSHGYPRDKYKSIGEVFQKSGLVSSPNEERIRFIYALSQELSRTISEIDGVLAARVHIVLPENNPLQEDVKPSSASVFIKYAPDSDVATHIPQIKMLVVNSIEGLVYDNVTAVTVPADAPVESVSRHTYRDLLGIKLAESTVQRFWLIVGALAGLALFSLVIACYLALRLQRMKKTRTVAAGGTSHV